MTAYTSLQRVRRLTGTVTTNPDYVSDADLADTLLVYPNVYKAAAEVCRQSARYWIDAVNDNQAKEAHARWLALADKYDSMTAAADGGIYVGGASIDDNESLDEDTDLVQPRFRIDGDSMDGQFGYDNERYRR